MKTNSETLLVLTLYTESSPLYVRAALSLVSLECESKWAPDSVSMEHGEKNAMRSALFWNIAQRLVVILYRRFGTKYWSHIQGSVDGTDSLSRNVGIVRCVMSQTSSYLIYIAAEA
jgi:hypothetical protein